MMAHLLSNMDRGTVTDTAMLVKDRCCREQQGCSDPCWIIMPNAVREEEAHQ